MARRRRVERGEEEAAGEKPIYTEKIPRSLMPRKYLRGKKWHYFESLGRFVGIVLIMYILITMFRGQAEEDLSAIVLAAVGAGAVFYVTEVMSPRAQRVVRPIRVYRDGVLVYTSPLEKLLGKPSFMAKDDLRGIKVRRMQLLDEGEVKVLPSHLTFVLANGKKLDMGRRNSVELQTIIDKLKGLGIEEISR